MYQIREAKETEYALLGVLMVEVYSQLEGFPKEDEIPEYYRFLKNVGELTQSPKVKLFVAVSEEGSVDGGLVYFGDMHYYGAGETITKKQKAAAFRLLAVNSKARGKGLAKKLIEVCFQQARKEGFKELMIHSTEYMKVAWNIYEKMGFVRYPIIDFEKSGVFVYGFRYKL